jgi:hypothetical protein
MTEIEKETGMTDAIGMSIILKTPLSRDQISRNWE